MLALQFVSEGIWPQHILQEHTGGALGLPDPQSAGAGSQPSSMSTEKPPQRSSATQHPLKMREESLYIDIAERLIKTTSPSTMEGFNQFKNYLVEVRHLLFIDQLTESLVLTVACPSLEILQDLWHDYQSKHLKEVVEDSLVTEDILSEFNLEELHLRVTILEEDYTACRHKLIEQGEKYI